MFQLSVTRNCNNVVIEKSKKQKPNRNKLAMWLKFAYFNYLTIIWEFIHNNKR